MTTSSTRTKVLSRRRLGAALLCGAFLALGGGCYFEGGSMSSADRFTYASTSWQPKTISVIDTRTGETIWSMDVPVGRKLVIDFNEAPSSEINDDPSRPDIMLWDIMENDRYFGALANKVRVPGPGLRRVDVTLRPTPELPPDMAAQREGQQGAAGTPE
ncbi:MAG: hypothetical protein IBJ10_05185 [Phycisphaerales bacterium]|nr:hypothetical protein [Phycisphaerales bacterium]